MEYKLYQTTEGMVKVYETEYNLRVDVDNRYDEIFTDREALDEYLKSINAEFIGYDED